MYNNIIPPKLLYGSKAWEMYKHCANIGKEIDFEGSKSGRGFLEKVQWLRGYN